MKERLNFRQLIAVASMLFGLFFGAGNLIFPVHMGQLAGANSFVAAFGFIVTAVGLPLIGVAAFGISRSDDLLAMSSRVGKGYGVFFTCALYLTIGPLFAIPRCAATSFTIGVEPLLTGGAVTELAVFSVIFFALVLFFSLRPSKILTWVGRIINPLFLVFLAVLVVTALVKPIAPVSSVAPEGAYAASAFSAGFLDGYNTMDALASLAFGVIVVSVIRDLGIEHDAAVAGNTVRAGVFSCVFMGLIYLAMTIVGAQSRGAFAVSANGGIALADIAGYYFGTAGQLVLAVTVTLACLKTAIGLVTSCAEIFRVLFPKSMSYKAWAIVFSVVSLLIANIGLTMIIGYSVPVLMFLYPLTITLMLLSLFGHFFEYDKRVNVSVTVFTLAAAEYSIQDGAVRAFGEEISAAGVRKGDLVENAMTYIITNAEIFDSSDAAGIDSSKMEEYIDYRFTDENGNLRSEVQFLLVDITIRNNEMPQELNISSLELTYCEPSQTDLSVRSFYPLAYPAYFSNAGPRSGEYSSEYYHYTLPVGESLSVKVGWYVDLTEYDKGSLFLIFNSRIETLRQYLPLFPA